MSSKTKPLMAILSLTLICVLAMHEGLNGQLYSIIVVIVGALGGVEYYELMKKDGKAEP